MKHGIAIKDKKTGKIVEFEECAYGREALMVLSGMRRNLNREDYTADEVVLTDDEYDAYKKES